MCSHGLRNVSSWFAACVLMDVACVFIFNACVLILYACVLMVCCACRVLYVHTGTRIRIGDQEHCLKRYVKHRVLTVVEKVTEAVDGGGEEGPDDKDDGYEGYGGCGGGRSTWRRKRPASPSGSDDDAPASPPAKCRRFQQRDRKTVANIRDWFIDEGHIKEDVVEVAENNNTKTQEDEFYNPEPGSKYWEKHWPKGNFIFFRICVATMILHACV